MKRYTDLSFLVVLKGFPCIQTKLAVWILPPAPRKTVIETKQTCFSVALVTSEAPAFQPTQPRAGNERNVSSLDQKHIPYLPSHVALGDYSTALGLISAPTQWTQPLCGMESLEIFGSCMAPVLSTVECDSVYLIFLLPEPQMSHENFSLAMIPVSVRSSVVKKHHDHGILIKKNI